MQLDEARRSATQSPLIALPRTRLRPLTRRAHVRIPGGTAAVIERVAWGDPVRDQQVAAAVSVVPGAALPATFRRPVPGADLEVVLGAQESGVAPGRHRRAHPAWRMLRHVPGWQVCHTASAEVDPEVPQSDARIAAQVAEAAAAGSPAVEDDLEDEFEDEFEGEFEGDLEDEGPLVPGQRDADDDEPGYRRRRRRAPAPATRSAVQAAHARIDGAHGGPEIARAVTEEAAALVGADVAALVLRAVEGPRVLWIDPGGPDADGLWGPSTLGALLGVGRPVRRIVEDDPLAGGVSTALLAVPVPSGGAIAGTLLVRRHAARSFTATEQDVLTRVARMAGVALLTAAQPSPRARRDVDDVTGLPGPARFAAEVEAAVRAAERQLVPVAVLALHIDGLSRLRTELGDAIADDAMRGVARAVGGVLRVGDLAYRIGENELALLLPATDAAGVPSIRERLEAVTAETVDVLALPGRPRALGLRSAPVPVDGLRAGHQVVDAANRALELHRQKVRWTAG